MSQTNSDFEYLRELCENSLLDRYPEASREQAKQRLEHELGVIQQSGLAHCLLIAADIAQFARNLRIFCRLTPPGNQSLVAYLLGMFDTDPLHYGLQFERLYDSDEHGHPVFVFAVDPSYAKPLSQFAHHRCDPDMLEEEISFKRLQVEDAPPYHTLELSCGKPDVLPWRLCFRVTNRWELAPHLIAEIIRSSRDPQFNLATIPTDDAMTFALIQDDCDLGIFPPWNDEWDTTAVCFPGATCMMDIAEQQAQWRWYAEESFGKAMAEAIDSYRMVYLAAHYPTEFHAAVHARWPHLHAPAAPDPL